MSDECHRIEIEQLGHSAVFVSITSNTSPFPVPVFPVSAVFGALSAGRRNPAVEAAANLAGHFP